MENKLEIYEKVIRNLYSYINLDEIIIHLDKNTHNFEIFDISKILSINEFSNIKEDSIKKGFHIIKILLNNDGSMTNFLKMLIENNNNNANSKKRFLKMDILENKNFDITNISNENYQFKSFFEQLQNSFEFKINSSKIIKRIIEFHFEEYDNKNRNNIMFGISFWDEEKFNRLYEKEEEKEKPIGVILKEKKIEFYKEIKNYFWEVNEVNENRNLKDVILIRISKFFKDNNIFFFLIETFEMKKLILLIDNLLK